MCEQSERESAISLSFSLGDTVTPSAFSFLSFLSFSLIDGLHLSGPCQQTCRPLIEWLQSTLLLLLSLQALLIAASKTELSWAELSFSSEEQNSTTQFRKAVGKFSSSRSWLQFPSFSLLARRHLALDWLGWITYHLSHTHILPVHTHNVECLCFPFSLSLLCPLIVGPTANYAAIFCLMRPIWEVWEERWALRAEPEPTFECWSLNEGLRGWMKMNCATAVFLSRTVTHCYSLALKSPFSFSSFSSATPEL